MANPIVPAVIAGLVAGIAFIVIMSLASFETSVSYYTSGLIDEISPISELDMGNNKQIIDVILQNSTVVELLKDKNILLFKIEDMEKGCGFDACAEVYLWERNDENNFTDKATWILVDYSNQKVIRIQDNYRSQQTEG